MRAEGSGPFEGGRHDEACAEIEDTSVPMGGSELRAVPGATRRASSDATFDLPVEGIDLDQLERRLVEQALQRTAGNKTRAGALLGLTRDQVRYRMQKYGMRKYGMHAGRD